MRPDVGRFLEGRLLETINLIKTIYDTALGAGPDVEAWIDGRELVFSKGQAGHGRGFLRAIPHETAVTIAFPRGHELLDPKKRARGAKGSETRMLIRDQADFDLYVRRMLDAAYSIEH
jgi:hypothetical protein